MKRKIVASAFCVLGALTISSVAYGQGNIVFQNYDFSSSGAALNAPVTYSESGIAVGGEFHAILMYSLNGGVTYEYINPSVNGNTTYPTTFGFDPSTADGDAGNYAGYFFGNSVVLPDYTSGNVTFIVQAYSGSSFGEAGFYSGQSSPFVVSASNITTGNTPASGPLIGMQGFTVSLVAVPEPSTLALAGLGGFGMLMAMRRKKA